MNVGGQCGFIWLSVAVVFGKALMKIHQTLDWLSRCKNALSGRRSQSSLIWSNYQTPQRSREGWRHLLFSLLCVAFISSITQQLSAGEPVAILPASVVEGSGILSNAGQINLGTLAVSNVVVSLQSSDTASLAVPASVTIPMGQSNAFFNLTVGDNLIAEGNRDVAVTAAASFFTNTPVVRVLDNDPDHIQFAAVPLVTDTNTGFFVQVTAVNADGSVQTNFNGNLSMVAEGIEGALPLASTNSGGFIHGQRNVSIQVTAPGHGVRVGCLEYPGLSDAFTVVLPVFYSSSQPVADIVWDQSSHTLLASVPANGGVYSNRLVAIDPASGMVTNSYPVGFDPGQLEISPDENYLYLTLSNRTGLQRFDLGTKVAGAPIGLGTNGDAFRFAYDLCVPPGMADSVVVAARLQNNLGSTSVDGIYRYDNGQAVTLPNFSAAGGWLLESMDTGHKVALSPGLTVGDASTGSVLAIAPVFSGQAVIYRDGEFFDDHGNAYSSASLAQLGAYPGVLDQVYYHALSEVDPAFRRVYYLSGYFNYGWAFYKLKVYDRDLFTPLFQLDIPPATGSPTRLLRCDTNCLAYVTGNNQLWFIRPDATQPQPPPTDLSVAISSAEPPPVVGENYTFMLSLSNAGPGTASVVQVTNALPANTELRQTVPSVGTVSPGNSAFVWSVSDLGAGSNVTLAVTVQFKNGGWQTNSVWALGFEADPQFTNNVATLPVYAQLPQEAFGVFPVSCACQDLVYDPVRDRLLLSVTNGVDPGQTNGLEVFNPYSGQVDSFLSTEVAPGKMARSDDGYFLYVSLPDAGTVQQFDLPSLTPNYSFAIGGEQIYGVQYTNYARNLAVVPGQPDAVVAWTVRHPYAGSLEYGYGLALYQGGVMGSNVTAFGGSWEPVFDIDTGTLFGYNNGDLRRCTLDSTGIAFAEQYPTISSAGGDIEYGGGHLFTSGGDLVEYNPFQVGWLFAGAQNSAAVVPDPVSGRVFFLVQNNGWQIRAYDVATRRFLGSEAVANLIGTPEKLIRWGADGLAFQTTGKQLFIIRSPLVRTDVFADLALTVAGPQTPVSPGESAAFTLTVTNQGSLLATNVVITNLLSAGATLSTISTSTGSWFTNVSGQSVVWSLPSLDAGAHATLSYTSQSLQTGLVTVVSTATTTTFDPTFSNNTVVTTMMVGGPITLDQPLSFQLPANDIVWSPSLSKFLVTANSRLVNWAGGLLSVDPTSYSVQFQNSLGADAGRLAISQDGTVLYAGADYGAAEVTIPSLFVARRFLINPTSPGAYAFDIKVNPNDNQMVAIGAKTTANNSTWVTAFDHGAQLSGMDSFYSTVLSLEFGGLSSPLYAYNGTSFARYNLNSNGVSVLDSTSSLLPARTAMELVQGGGKIYSSAGPVIDPENLTLMGAIAGIPAGTHMVYDEASGLVFFLTSAGELKAFDGATLLPVGSRTVPGLSGSITRFIRWGADGFAALTSNDQLLVFHSSLIPTNPPADVSVSLNLDPPPYIQGAEQTAVMIISNAGPNMATSVTWNNTLPAGASILSANASSGSLATGSESVTGVIPNLSAGSAATITVQFSLSTQGIVSDHIAASASSIDPNFANNLATATLWMQPTNGFPSPTLFTLPVKDLEPDPVRPVIYASLGSAAGVLADSVAVIDPVNKDINIGAQMPAGSDPGRLAVSADGEFLYVALDGMGEVQKLSLPGLATVGSFMVPNNQKVVRMQVCPTNSDMVVIRRSPDGRTSLHVAGVERPNELSSQDLFAFSDTTGQLFGCDGFHSNVKLYELNTGASGLGLLASQPGKQSNATDLKSSGGLLFYNGGMVVNPATSRGVDLMPVPYNSLVAPDAGCGRAFYLTPGIGGWSLCAFDIGQGIEVGSVSLPGLSSAPQKLFRWGTDGLALYNANSQVVILQGVLVPTNLPVDVRLTQTIGLPSASTSETNTFLLEVTNLGPVTATKVIVRQSFSANMSDVSAMASVGTVTSSNSGVLWQVDDLPAGATATLMVSGQAAQEGTLTVTALATHYQNDRFWGDNAAVGAVNVSNTNSNDTLRLQLAARQLIYDSTRNLIYASTPASNQLAGNLIAMIDPATGAIKRALPAGSEPDRISLSDDGMYLNVALDGEMGIRRFNLDSNLPDLAFGFSTNDIYFAQDLVTQPSHPETVAVSLGSYNYASGYPSTVLAYDSGTPRPNTGGPARGLAFSDDGSFLYGSVAPGIGTGFRLMTLNAQGFSTASKGGFTTAPGNLVFDNGRLYSSSGQVVDADTATLLGSFSTSGSQAVDSRAGRVFYLTQSGGNCQIRAFDLTTLQPCGTQTVANVTGTAGSLIVCGQDRLAFLTSAGQICVVHSPLTIANATNPPTPVLNLANPEGAGSFPPVLQAGVEPGYWYTLETSTNLVNWNVLSNFFSTVPDIQIDDSRAKSFPVRFYRLKAP